MPGSAASIDAVHEAPVYVLEPAPAIGVLVAGLVQQLGRRAQTFADAASCRAAIEAHPPAMILVGGDREDLPGLELCRSLKQERRFRHLPVVAMIEGTEPMAIIGSWRAGADDVLQKPLRREQLAAKLDAARRANRENLPVRAAPRRLLLVDDSRFFRSVLGSTLENVGFHVLYARSGEEALELAARNRDVDLLLIDWVLPGTNGPDVLRSLRAQLGADKPAFLMTGFERTAAQEQLASQLTGHPLYDKRVLPIDAIVSRVNTALRRVAADLRAHERRPFFSLAEFRAREGGWATGYTYDLSPGGVFIRTLTPAAPMSEVEVSLRLSVLEPVTAGGIVAWSNPWGPRKEYSYAAGLAVAFSSLPPGARTQLERLTRNMESPAK